MKLYQRRQLLLLFAFSLTTLPGAILGQNLLVNGGFEEPGGPNNYYLFDESSVPGWETAGGDPRIEIWHSGFDNYSGGPVPAFEGVHFAEISGASDFNLYQDFVTPEMGLVDYSFAHRGRMGVDGMQVDITYFGLDGLFGTADDVLMVDGNLAANQYSAGNTAWISTQVDNAFTSVVGGNYRITFTATSEASGNEGIGNFLDNVVVSVPEPSAVILMGAAGLLALLRRRRTI